jgi:hypothetical protein
MHLRFADYLKHRGLLIAVSNHSVNIRARDIMNPAINTHAIDRDSLAGVYEYWR